MNKASWPYNAILIFSILLSLFLHKDFMGMELQGIHTWRQSQTMWNIRNFVRHDANILNPRVSHFNGGKDNIYRYEFPVMQWGIAMVEKITGEHILVVRSLLFLLGILSTLGIYFLVKLVTQSSIVAVMTAVLFQFAPIFFYYSINPLPDNLALSGAIWYLYFILKYKESPKQYYLLYGSISLLIATLAKLPFLMMAIISIVFFAQDFLKQKKFTKDNVKFAAVQLVMLIPAVAWYVWVMPGWEGNPITTGVFSGGLWHMENLRIIKYNLFHIFPREFLSPATWLLIIIGAYCVIKDTRNYIWLFFLIGITLLYLILESNAIAAVHDYYLLPYLPWLYIVVGWGIKKVFDYSVILKCLLFGVVVYGIVYGAKVTRPMWSLEVTGFNNDVFLYRDALKNAVPNDEKCIIINDESYYIFSYQIDKMGFIFDHDNLPAAWVDDMVRNYGVKYMYSDSKVVNSSPDIARYVDHVILQAGSITVSSLKIPVIANQ